MNERFFWNVLGKEVWGMEIMQSEARVGHMPQKDSKPCLIFWGKCPQKKEEAGDIP
jgi:hypothetical protein